jgi:tetratricopeptide (TPR) repeat protein
MRAHHAIAGVACPPLLAVCLLLVAACSSAPPSSDTVSTMKRQAAQDGSYGEAYLRQGRYELALQFTTLSLNEYTSVDDREGVIRSYNAIGTTYLAMGSLDKAEEVLLRAQGLSRGAGNFLLVVSSISLGELYLAKGDSQKALDVLQEALGLPEASRTPAQTAVLYHDIGTAERNLGDPVTALASYSLSLQANLKARRVDMAASDYYMIASVHSQAGRFDEAAKSAALALDLDKQIENSPGIAKDLYALGLIAVKRRDMAAAYDFFQRSYFVNVTLGFRAEMRKALAGLISAADALGMTADAETWRKALTDLGSS